MTQPENIWRRKIQAFLCTPPYSALTPDIAKKHATELIAAALDEQTDPLPSEIVQANQIAAGIDIPPLVPDAPVDLFRKDPHLTHPLSGETYPLADLNEKLQSIPCEQLSSQLQQDVIAAIETIRQKVDRSQPKSHEPFDKRLFLALWRKLSETIKKQYDSVQLGPAWDVLPADPRIPSHSVWDHAGVASAVAAALPNPAFLLFTIGSVQEFVGTARRTQDFWMGSFLFSYLMWAGIRVLADQYGPDCLIYPSLQRQPLVDLWLQKKAIKLEDPPSEALQIANFPNTLTAIVPADQAEDIAKQMRQALLDKWKEIACAVKRGIEAEAASEEYKQLSNDTAWKGIWKREIDDCFSRIGFFWVACPWGEDPQAAMQTYEARIPDEPSAQVRKRYDDFASLIQQCQESAELNIGMMYQPLSTLASWALTERKQIRDFPNQCPEPGWKCSLCGLRQALCPSDAQNNEADLRRFWEGLSRVRGSLKLEGRIRYGDRLCAVCLVKRLAMEAYFEKKLGFDHHLFPSTASIATAPFKYKAIEQFQHDNLPELEQYVRTVKHFLNAHRILYPSSALPKLKALQEALSGEKYRTVKDFLQIDGEWLFEESFEPDKIAREYRVKRADLNEERRLAAVQALRALLDAVQPGSDAPRPHPSRYYAVVAMDGDKMGNWIGGLLAPQLGWLFHPGVQDEAQHELSILYAMQRPLGPSLHLALSTAMKNFALDLARRVVEQLCCGKLIYAGGDDVLALVPVSDVLPAIQTLRRLFQGEECALNETAATAGIKTGHGFGTIKDDAGERLLLLSGAPGELPKIGKLPEVQGMTASVGVAIVHESHPLTHAIDEAFTQAMKQSAKEDFGRDAFAIHLLKRGGAPLHAGMKWYGQQNGKGPSDVIDRLLAVIQAIQENRLSSRLAYDLDQRKHGLSGALEDIPGSRFQTPWWHEAQKQQLGVLIDRHLSRGIAADEKKRIHTDLQKLLCAVQTFIRESTRERKSRGLPLGDFDPSWELMKNLLLLARFFAAEGNHVAQD